MNFLQRVEATLELDVPLDALDKDTKLTHLGADSAKLAEVGGMIEETYGVPMHEDDIFGLTVRDLYNFASEAPSGK